MITPGKLLLTIPLLALAASQVQSAVLLTSPGGVANESTVVISSVGAIVRNGASSDTVYFRYTVTNPASGGLVAENSFAAFELQNGGSSTVGVGNNWGAWAYSVFGNTGDADLNSANREPGLVFQYIRNTDVTTIAFSVAYNPSGADTITLWLDPDFGTTAAAQIANRTTTFTGDFSFTSLQLREGGAGNGWSFGDIQVATTPVEIGFVPEPSGAAFLLTAAFAMSRRRRTNAQ